MTQSTTTSNTLSPNSASTSRRTSASSTTSSDRRMSDTWDASKVPPSQFQRPKGSVFATPSSKDGNVDRGDRDKKYFEKLREKGWDSK